MSRLEEIFNKTISKYNENTSDINKFKFSQREKDIFKGMIRRYATEVAQASLEKASESAKTQERIDEKSGSYHWVTIVVDKESITNPENIILL